MNGRGFAPILEALAIPLAVVGLAWFLLRRKSDQDAYGPAFPSGDADMPEIPPGYSPEDSGLATIYVVALKVDGTLFGETFGGGRVSGEARNDGTKDWQGTLSFAARPLDGIYGADSVIAGKIDGVSIPAGQTVPFSINADGRLGWDVPGIGGSYDVSTFYDGRRSWSGVLR